MLYSLDVMIEDLQDEFQEEKPRHKKTKGLGRGAFLALAFVFWILYAGVIGIISAPKAIVAVRESGVVDYIEGVLKQRSLPDTHKASVCYAIPISQTSVVYRLFSQDVPRTGATLYHDAMEGLLAGPSQDALSAGAVTFIAQGTTLKGLTVSENVAFVDFSGEFASSGSSWGPGGLETARMQIESTLKAVDASLEKVIILVDGEVLDI